MYSTINDPDFHALVRAGLKSVPPLPPQMRNPYQPPLASARNKPSIKLIQSAVAEYGGITLEEMIVKKRGPQYIARLRQAAMFLTRELTDYSLPHIAREFKREDHTTVMFACKRVRAEAESDANYGATIDALRLAISSLHEQLLIRAAERSSPVRRLPLAV